MVTSKKAHETTTRLLTPWLLLLRLLLRLSTIVEEATHELPGKTSNTSGTATGMRGLTTVLPAQQRARKSGERRLILRLVFSSGDCIHRQILIIAVSTLFSCSDSIHVPPIDFYPFLHLLLPPLL